MKRISQGLKHIDQVVKRTDQSLERKKLIVLQPYSQGFVGLILQRVLVDSM